MRASGYGRSARLLPSLGKAAVKKPVPSSNKTTLRVTPKPGEAEAEAVARTVLNPATGAALAIRFQPSDFNPMLELMAMVREVDAHSRQVQSGNLERCEATLAAQMQTLDQLFNRMLIQAAIRITTDFEQGEVLYRLAYRAQSQCRAVAEALAEMKYPRSVAFVKQQNIAGGHQQVNNGVSPRTEEKLIPQNELGGASHGNGLDSGAAGAASGADSTMAAVGAVNRPAHDQRKVTRLPKRKQGRH